MSLSRANDGYIEEGLGTHLLYGTKGQGRAKFLLDGQILDGSWLKESRTDRTQFIDSQNQEIKLNRGLIWIEILPVGQEIKVDLWYVKLKVIGSNVV